MSKTTSGLWPIHLKPKDDELLSSWLIRLATAHKMHPKTFYSIELPENPNFLKRIDETEDPKSLKWISQKTGVSLGEVEATTLAYYGERSFFQYPSPRANPFPWYMSFDWIMPISYEPVNEFFGIQFCPQCLQEDDEPYFRRKWRFAFVTHCKKHRVMLLDRCTKCGASINFLNNTYKSELKIRRISMIRCRSCDADIRRVARQSVPCSVDSKEIQYQEHLVSLLDGCWWKTNRGESFTSTSYFRVLHKLMKVLAFDELGLFLRVTIMRLYKLPISTVKKINHNCLERLSISERRELLILARRIIKDWPGYFSTLEALMKEILPPYRQSELRYYGELNRRGTSEFN